MISNRIRVPSLKPAPRCLRSVAPVPIARPSRWSSVVRRFKDDETPADLQKRKEREEVIRKQEELIQQAGRDVSEAAGSAREELKKWLQKPQRLQDVGKVVDTVERTSWGKGYGSSVRVPIWMPAFTRRREIFVGRIAMLGFFATCVLEILTANHLGPIRQVQLWSGLSESTIVAVMAGIVIYNVLGGMGPWSPTFSPENLRDVAKCPEGPPNTLVNPFDVGRLLGVSGWGFTKRNELFHGRLAMLGFLAAVVNEINTGRGALGQVAGYLGLVPDDTYYSAVINGFILFTTLMMGMSILFPSRLQGSAAHEDDIY